MSKRKRPPHFCAIAALAMLSIWDSPVPARDPFAPPLPARGARLSSSPAPGEGQLPGYSSDYLAAADALILKPAGQSAELLVVAYAFDDVIVVAAADAGSYSAVAEYKVGIAAGAGNDLPRRIEACDFDQDGLLDLAVLCSGNTELNTPPSLGILYGLPSGQFSPFRSIPLAGGSPPGGEPVFSLALAVGLIDGDGLPDLAVGHFDSRQVTVLLNRGARQWGAASVFTVPTQGSGPCEILIRDIGGDGKSDLVTINRKDVQVWKGKGDGTYFSAKQVALGDSAPTFTDGALGDFNADGTTDLALIDGVSSKLTALKSLNEDGISSASFETQLTAGAQPIALAVYDANNDTRHDAAVVYLAGAGGDLLLGQPAGSAQMLAVERPFATAARPRSIRMARSSEGAPRLLAANEGDLQAAGNQDITLADGTAGAGPRPALDANPGAHAVKVAEFDYPMGLSWDAAGGTLWTVERREQLLARVSLTGQRLDDFSLAANGQKQDIAGVCVDPAGGWWFVDRNAATVAHRNSARAIDIAFSTAASGVTNPVAVAFNAASQYIFVADTYLPIVAVYNPDGALVTTLSLPNGPLRSLTWDPDEQVLWTIPAQQTDRVQWVRWPLPMAPPHSPVTSARVIQLRSITQLLDGQSALSVAVDPAGRRFWVLMESGTILEAKTDGNVFVNARELSLLRNPGGLAIETSGTLLIADSAPLGTVIRTTLTGEAVTSFTFAQNVGRPVQIRGIAQLGDKIYVLDGDGEILISDLNGIYLGKFARGELKHLDARGMHGEPATGRLVVGKPGELLELSVPSIGSEGQVEPELTAGGKIEARHPLPLSITPSAISGALLGAGYSVFDAAAVSLTMLRADFAVTGSVTQIEGFPQAGNALMMADPDRDGEWLAIVHGPQLLTGETSGIASATDAAWTLYD